MRGGKREGSGRPPGKLNKRTTKVYEELEAGGEMPLDRLLKRMRDKKVDKAAAPYCHPRLASTEVSGPDGAAIEMNISMRDKARRMLAILRRAQRETPE